MVAAAVGILVAGTAEAGLHRLGPVAVPTAPVRAAVTTAVQAVDGPPAVATAASTELVDGDQAWRAAATPALAASLGSTPAHLTGARVEWARAVPGAVPGTARVVVLVTATSLGSQPQRTVAVALDWQLVRSGGRWLLTGLT